MPHRRERAESRWRGFQQVGHFLYVLDRSNRQIVIVNSNRFTILDTIRLSDPVSMTISPNMTRLAVTNFASSTRWSSIFKT